MKPILILGATAGVLAGALLFTQTHPEAGPASAQPGKSIAASSAVEPYPFATSVVSGEKLNPKDEIVTFTQDGYQIRLASQAEADAFKKNPTVFEAKIAAAYQHPRPNPFDVCPVMHDKLDATAYSFVFEGREFKLCCDACVEDIQKDPDKFVKLWEDAARTKAVAGK